MSENTEFWSEFFQLYRDNPCLWQIKSIAYLNKNKKNEAYETLRQKLQQLYPDATKDLVKKKLNNYRSTFRKELKKVQNSMQSGSGAEDVYMPSWSHYNDLLFLADQEAVKSSTSNVEPQETQECNAADDEEVIDESDSSFNCSNPANPNSQDVQLVRKKARVVSATKRNRVDELVTVIRDRLKNATDDKFEHVGKAIGAKLRELPKSQSIYAEKLINDIMFAAELGQLDSQHFCNDPSHIVMPGHTTFTPTHAALPKLHLI